MRTKLVLWTHSHHGRYLAAVVPVTIAAIVRRVLEPITGFGAPWVVFFTGVLLVALYLGRGPAIFATLLSAVLAIWLFVLPAGHTISEAMVQGALWTIDGLILAYLASLLTRRRAQAVAAAAALERSEERLRLAAEAARIGSYDIDATTETIVGSPEFYAVLGIAPAGRQRLQVVFDTVPAEELDATRTAYRRSVNPSGDGRMRLQTRVVHPDGTLHWISWVGSTSFEDRPTGRVPVRQVGVVVDVTEQRLAEAELRELNAKKDHFLGMLSHELRNPLAAIRASVDVLEHCSPTGDEAGRARNVIDRQVSQLARLTDDLLDVTRIARGKLVLQRERLELGTLVRTALDDMRPLADGIVLELDLGSQPLWLDGDAARMTQVINNLVHNAIKFTPRGGRIEVSLRREREEIVLHVRDSGAGIPPDALSQIFEPFVQVPASPGVASGGLGLGLALVKGIVEQHRGSVAAASEGLGYGTELTVRLPIAQGPALQASATGPLPSGRSRVLVIEDNPDIIEMMQDALALIGHDVRIALDGRSGLATAVEFLPDVVLCDIGLPDISGYEVARRLRSIGALHDTLLVALTGYGQLEDRERAREAGFARLITKPATLKALQEVIVRAA